MCSLRVGQAARICNARAAGRQKIDAQVSAACDALIAARADEEKKEKPTVEGQDGEASEEPATDPPKTDEPAKE